MSNKNDIFQPTISNQINLNQTKVITTKCQVLENKLIINSKKSIFFKIDFLNIKRKKYSMFSSEVKKKCIEAVINKSYNKFLKKIKKKLKQSKCNDLKAVSKMFAVPLKSLKRWIKVGPERKKGKNIFNVNFYLQEEVGKLEILKWKKFYLIGMKN